MHNLIIEMPHTGSMYVKRLWNRDQLDVCNWNDCSFTGREKFPFGLPAASFLNIF